jgi:UDP-2,3-diacylglucosamine pyrophosphatase LpxH
MKRYPLFLVLAWVGAAADPVHFAILGDRTGEVQAGVFEQVWKEVDAAKPEFVVTVGDTIQGLHDQTAEAEWRDVERILLPHKKKHPLYLTPGNHDVWSPLSERLFREHAGHPVHYSFDRGPVHFTVLDNSRGDQLAAEEIAFLEADLKEHAAAPAKFVVMHRPSWLFQVALKNPNFPLHQLATKYGVQWVIAGHVHQMMYGELEGVRYLSMPSAGGHLRNSGQYDDGWFFGFAMVEAGGDETRFQIRELKAPHGEGRVSKPEDWTLLGRQRAAGGSRSAGIAAR